ncbi:hypothetical protein AQUCO_04400050v1 [Aquilegia coerulea]|uniref:OBG-type G domain-containing protein n=1 Tax=Aquilegia coerulea TaxID=218851 RepID=A0A2G5CMR7_AQUCA|nr:hypothetical protein AQUCO_04400050v1 [Aquilegia coerulea]
MSGSASNLLQLWYIPSTKLFIRTSMLPKTKGLFPEARKQVNAPSMFFCRNLQTTTYEVVKGSYVPVTQTKSETANEVLGRVNALKKKVVSVGKEHASLCAKSTTKREAEERLSEGMKKLEAIFKLEAKAVDDLLNIAKTLRAVPVVDLETPTLCLVGAPNVGKSSLVRILSTGKPEVCNYPFTTRGILMGHITVNYQRFQVTDTPGLLRRCDDDRNNLEKLTLAVLSHLPTAVLYVHDLTGECGTSPSNQYIIYKEVRERFSNHLWVDVVSKCDLLQKSPVDNITEDGDEDSLEMARYRKAGPEGAILVSVKTETGLDELKSRVHDMLISQLDKLKSESASPES